MCNYVVENESYIKLTVEYIFSVEHECIFVINLNTWEKKFYMP